MKAALRVVFFFVFLVCGLPPVANAQAFSNKEPSQREIERAVLSLLRPGATISSINYEIFSDDERGTGRVSFVATYFLDSDLYIVTQGGARDILERNKQHGATYQKFVEFWFSAAPKFAGNKGIFRQAKLSWPAGRELNIRGDIAYVRGVDRFRFVSAGGISGDSPRGDPAIGNAYIVDSEIYKEIERDFLIYLGVNVSQTTNNESTTSFSELLETEDGGSADRLPVEKGEFAVKPDLCSVATDAPLEDMPREPMEQRVIVADDGFVFSGMICSFNAINRTSMYSYMVSASCQVSDGTTINRDIALAKVTEASFSIGARNFAKCNSQNAVEAREAVAAGGATAVSPYGGLDIGTWRGTVIDDDYASGSYSIRVTATNEMISVEYPELDCSGRWEFIGNTSDQKTLFRETITEGLERCAASGRVVISTKAEETLAFEWLQERGSEVSAFGDIFKVR